MPTDAQIMEKLLSDRIKLEAKVAAFVEATEKAQQQFNYGDQPGCTRADVQDALNAAKAL